MPHARSGRDGRQEGRECSYYDLHCYLNDAFLHPLPLVLGGILLLRSDVNLLLNAVGGQGALVLERYRGDLVLSGSLGLEADVDALDVGVRVPLTLQQGSPGDALLGALHGGHEGAESVDLDGVTLREQLADTA